MVTCSLQAALTAVVSAVVLCYGRSAPQGTCITSGIHALVTRVVQTIVGALQTCLLSQAVSARQSSGAFVQCKWLVLVPTLPYFPLQQCRSG
jgi:hypothetical protein